MPAEKPTQKEQNLIIGFFLTIGVIGLVVFLANNSGPESQIGHVEQSDQESGMTSALQDATNYGRHAGIEDGMAAQKRGDPIPSNDLLEKLAEDSAAYAKTGHPMEYEDGYHDGFALGYTAQAAGKAPAF
jgi:hypothetical protein